MDEVEFIDIGYRDGGCYRTERIILPIGPTFGMRFIKDKIFEIISQAQPEDSADASNQRTPTITTDGDPPMNRRKTGDIHG